MVNKILHVLCSHMHTGMLESFHSLLLGYSTKRTAYQNEGYLARVQLAVLDHNALTGRENALNHNDDIIYHRKYRKQTKKWDVAPTKSDTVQIHPRVDESHP